MKIERAWSRRGQESKRRANGGFSPETSSFQRSMSNVLRLKVWETGQAKAPVPLRLEPRYLVCYFFGRGDCGFTWVKEWV